MSGVAGFAELCKFAIVVSCKNDHFLAAKADLVAVKQPPVFTTAAKVSLSPILIVSVHSYQQRFATLTCSLQRQTLAAMVGTEIGPRRWGEEGQCT